MSFTVPEFLGVGIAFGSLFSLLSECIFRDTILREFSWLIPGFIFILSLSLPILRRKIFNFEIQQTPSRDLAFLFSLTILSISLLWVWALPLVIVPFAFSASKNRHRRILVICLSLAAIVASQLFRSASTSWWIFSHDQMYLEGFGESIYRYGQHENIHLIGYGFPYHWFSLLWSAVLTHAAHLSPLVGIGIMLPIVAIFACVNLLWVVTHQHSRIAGYISVTAFSLGSNPINWTAIRFTNSPTFLFSLIWLLAFVYIFSLALKESSLLLDLALGLLLFGSFGGKVTHGIIILAGLCIVLLAKIFQRPRITGLVRMLQMYSVLSIATLAIYFMFYQRAGVGGNMLYFSPGELGFQVGIAYMSSSRWIWIIATIAILGGCSSMFILALKNNYETDSDQSLNIFCIGSFLLSLFLTFSLAQEGGSQGYFLLSASVIILIPASKTIAHLIPNEKDQFFTVGKRWALLGCAMYCFVAVRYWNYSPAGIDLYRFGLIFKIGVFIFPILIFIFLRVTLKIKESRPGLLLLFAVFLLFGIFHRAAGIADYISTHSIKAKIEPISGSPQRTEALTWLRNNSHENDVIATNRFCIPNLDPCNKKWYLASAISRRRLLIEGFGYGLSSSESVSVASERMINSMEFGRRPNQHLWKYLNSFNVKWFIVDAAAGRVTDSWEPYATVIYQNSEMKILKVSDHL